MAVFSKHTELFTGDFAVGTHYKVVPCAEWTIGGLQWHLDDNTGQKAILGVYSSLLQWDDKRLMPATSANGWWEYEVNAVFLYQPGDVVKASSCRFNMSAACSLLVKLEVTVPLVDFTMLFRGQEG